MMKGRTGCSRYMKSNEGGCLGVTRHMSLGHVRLHMEVRDWDRLQVQHAIVTDEDVSERH